MSSPEKADKSGSESKIEGDLNALRMDEVRKAIDIYLSIAYSGVEAPESVRARLRWPEGESAAALLGRAPFEKVGRTDTPGPTIFALRLGNVRYPHMKLQIQPWPNAAGFLLSVNTHDQVLALDPDAADSSAFRTLQAENQRLKETIENAWDTAGLPTFLRYLRDYLVERNSPLVHSEDLGAEKNRPV